MGGKRSWEERNCMRFRLSWDKAFQASGAARNLLAAQRKRSLERSVEAGRRAFSAPQLGGYRSRIATHSNDRVMDMQRV